MKSFIALLLIVVMAPAAFSQGFIKKKSVESAATPAATTTATKGDAPAAKAVKGKGWTGTVCTVVGCAGGKGSSLSKADAKKAADRGEMLCLCVGKKCYIVINSDGTSANGKLADHAGANVTVSGKLLSKNGLSVILADNIQ